MIDKNILKNNIKGEILFDEKMSNHTSYGVGGKVNAYIRPRDKTELIKIIKLINENKSKVYYFGSGSNLLVNDKDINGYVISPTKAIKSLMIQDNIIQADAGVMLGRLVKESMRNELTGLESLAGVPGTLGGALKMNAGAWGSEISNFLVSVDVIDSKGDIKTLSPDNLKFQYRSSSFSSNDFIVSARFKLQKSTQKNIRHKKKIASDGRIKTQPLKYRSAGSVFKNPTSFLAAGFLIDKLGLKGTICGDAEISTHHANFFINHGNAKAKDIAHLIKLSRMSIFEHFGIMLDLEVKTIGFKNKELFPYD